MAKFSRSNLLVFMVALVGSLAVAELVLRATTPAAPNIHQLFCEHDPLLGWRKIPNKEGRHTTAEYDVLEKMNAQGIRGPEYPLEKPPGQRRILVLGDSFAEGYTVDFEALFSEKLKAALNANCAAPHEVINAGTGGWSTDQELLFFENIGEKYRPDITVLLFCSNDPWYNAQPRYWRGFKPLFVQTGDSLRLTNVPVPTLASLSFFEKTKTWGLENLQLAKYLKRVKDRLAFAEGSHNLPVEWEVYRRNYIPEMAHAWDLTAALLTRLQLQTAATGSSLLVFYIPEKIEVYPTGWENFLATYSLPGEDFRPERPRQHLREICDRLGVPLLDPTECFIAEAQANPAKPLYFKHDWHWNAHGHALTGQLLFEKIGCGERPPELQIAPK